MKTVVYSVFAALVLSACATGPTAYGPAQGRGLGFGTRQIEQDRFQVSFTGRSADEARNLSLLRAAEVTLEQGYDYFRVIGSDVYHDEPRRSPVSTTVGLGFGSHSGYRRHHRGGSYSNVGLAININDVARALEGSKVTSGMEILLGKGEVQPAYDVYDAREIMDNLGPQVFTY